MISVQIGSAKSLTCKLGDINSITTNNSGYALLKPYGCDVVLLDRNLCLRKTVNTAQNYSNLCYDSRGGCYWAVVQRNASVLYLLNSDFSEQSQFSLRGLNHQRLSGISCGSYKGKDGIWLAFANSIAFVHSRDGKLEHFPSSDPNPINSNILGICGGLMLSYTEDGKKFIQILYSDCEEHFEFLIPNEFHLKAMLLRDSPRSEKKEGMTNHVRLLLSKNNNCEEMAIDCQICCGHPCDCCEAHPCCDCEPRPCCEGKPHSCCDCDPHSCHSCNPKPCCDCSTQWELIHSIALEEAGIAHILNAEGEKLQKAVAICNNIDDLICVNLSVKHTITQITQLEGVLYSKLEAIMSCPPPCD